MSDLPNLKRTDKLMSDEATHELERTRYSFPRLDQVTVYAIALERLTGKQTPLPAPEAQWSARSGTPAPA